MDPNGIESTETGGLFVEESSLQVVTDDNKSHTIETVSYYKIPATMFYMDIKDGTVIVGTMSGSEADRSKRIRKVVVMESSSDQVVHIKVALFSESFSKYIVIRHGNQVGLDDSPMWYICNSTSECISFKSTDQFEMDVFLAFDAETCRIVARPSEFHFNEFPAPTTRNVIV